MEDKREKLPEEDKPKTVPDTTKEEDSVEAQIEAAMARIVVDTIGEDPPQNAPSEPEDVISDSKEPLPEAEDAVSDPIEPLPESESGEEPEDTLESKEGDEKQKEPEVQPAAFVTVRPQARRSARPGKITYVHFEDEEADLPQELLAQAVRKKKHKGLKIAGVVMGMLAVAAGCTYGGISYFYSNHFFEGTTINGIDCSGKTPYQVEQEIAANVENYSIEVQSRNLPPQVIDGASIDYRYLSNGEVLGLLKEQKPYEWIRGYFEGKNCNVSRNITFDRTLLESQVKGLECAKEENQIPPENAYVAYTDSMFEIVPETQGSELNIKEAYRKLDEAISASETSVNFNEMPQVYESAAITSDDPDLKAKADAYNNFAKASITYTFGDENVVLDGTTIRNWLQLDEKGQLIKDDNSFRQHVAEFVAQLAARYDTVGTEREFYTTSGRTVYVYGSAYGWQIDQVSETDQLMQEITNGVQVTREPMYAMRANARGYNDFGDTYIEVDLSWQHMYYYQYGTLIFDSDFVSGNMSYADRQTPSGIYTLYYKKSPDVLRGTKKPDGTYEYEQKVTYCMPFNGVVGFHDATWRDSFGGDIYMYGGSHGCINLPYSSAAVLYDLIQYDVPIICFY